MLRQPVPKKAFLTVYSPEKRRELLKLLAVIAASFFLLQNFPIISFSSFFSQNKS